MLTNKKMSDIICSSTKTNHKEERKKDMTKKQYKRRMMESLRIFRSNYVPDEKMITDRISTPKWGTVISTGPHKGEVLRSYQQAWDTINAVINE